MKDIIMKDIHEYMNTGPVDAVTSYVLRHL